MLSVSLALGLLGTILGVASFTLSLYNLIVSQAQPAAPVSVDMVRSNRDSVYGVLRGDPQGPKAVVDNLGMPDVYDPELELEELEEVGL